MTSDPLAWQFIGNPVGDWLIGLGIATGIVAILLILRRVVGRRLHAKAGPVLGAPGHLVADLIQRTRVWFLVLFGVEMGLLHLTLPDRANLILRDAGVVGLLLQAGIWGNGVITFAVSRYLRRSTPSGEVGQAPTPTTVAALGLLARVVFWILLVLIALDNLGVHITTLVAGLGISGVAIALAVQNILGDLFSALAIVLDKPFVVGDSISIDNFGGTVEQIGLKTTRVRADSGEQVIFSNADLLKSRIRNWRRLRERTVTSSLWVDGSTAPNLIARVPTIMRELVVAQSQVRFERSHVTSILDGNVKVETVYVVLTPDYGVHMNVQQALALGVLQRFHEAGIRIAAPLRAITMRDPSIKAALSNTPVPSEA